METVQAELAFTRQADVSLDAERPGLLRAQTRGPEEAPGCFDLQSCRVRDWGAGRGLRPDLRRHGFDCIDLSAHGELLAVLEGVRAAGKVGEEQAREIRRRLAGQRFRLGDGSRIRLLHIAAEGFIMRKAGPNRMALDAPGSMTAMNGHDAARAVHVDQDVRGTPLRQMMRGAAPWLFRHDAPDSRNRWSPVWLLNLWIPLQQITRPLVLMDKRSIDRKAQQLRYGLPTDAFLDRDESRRVNDIWTFLHDERQQWYFCSELRLGRAYLFETLGTPHASFVLPGEELAERRYRQLDAAGEAIRRGDAQGLGRALVRDGASGAAIATRSLQRAIGTMDALLDEARRDPGALRGEPRSGDWCARAQRAMDAVVRKSIEMRVVAVRTPRLWARRQSSAPR